MRHELIVVPRTTSSRASCALLLLVAFGTTPLACGDGAPLAAPAAGGAGGTAGIGVGGTGAGRGGDGGKSSEAGKSGEPAKGGEAGAGGESGEGGEGGGGREAGGDDAGAGAPGGGAPDFPCAVRRAIEAKCQRCHTDPPENGAPFPLLTWNDTRAPYGLRVVYEAMLVAVESGFMPLTELPLSPPVEDLTPAEKTTLVSWLRAGAPADRSGASCDR